MWRHGVGSLLGFAVALGTAGMCWVCWPSDCRAPLAAPPSLLRQAKRPHKRQRETPAEPWCLQRARARLLLARVLLRQPFGSQATLESLLCRVAAILPECEVASVFSLRSQRRHAASLVAAGYNVEALWGQIARSRKQQWLSRATSELAGSTMRSTRQGMIDSIGRHYARYDSADAYASPLKKRNCMQIIDEAAPKPVDVFREYPNAVVLDTVGTTAACSPSIERQSTWEETMSRGHGKKSNMIGEVPQGVVLIFGPVGSGKTSLLQSWVQSLYTRAVDGLAQEALDQLLCPLTPEYNAKVLNWRRDKAIISQFGEPKAGCEWLGSVGLSSIPAWCTPHHALSTGQAYRADLARLIQWAASGCTNMSKPSAQSTQLHYLPLVAIEHFGNVLDKLTAASCASSFARQLRRYKLRGLLTSSDPTIAHWLQPDFIVNMDPSGSGQYQVIRNVNAGRRPIVRVHISTTEVTDSRHQQVASDNQTTVLDLSETTSSFCGLMVLGLHRFNQAENIDFEHDYAKEDRPTGGTLLRAVVSTDAATQMCDSIFDTEFDGKTITRVPDFPALSDLCHKNSWYRRSHECCKGELDLSGVGIGVLCGPSGCAKSVLMKLHFGSPRELHWKSDLSVLKHLLPCHDNCLVHEALETVGLNLHLAHDLPFCALSSGQQSLAEAARLLLEAPEYGNVVLIDEFCSFLDHSSGRQLARGLTKWFRVHGLRSLILAGGRVSDFIGPDGLQPDWLFQAETMLLYQLAPCNHTSTTYTCEVPVEGTQFQLREKEISGNIEIGLPKLVFRLNRCDPSMWRFFREHHYKTRALSKQADTFILQLSTISTGISNTQVNGNASAANIEQLASMLVPGMRVGFVATIPQSGAGVSDQRPTSGGVALPEKSDLTSQRPARRAHRTVIKPSWQGLGLGSRLSDAIAELHSLEGFKYYGQTVHPRFGSYRDRSPLWQPTLWNHSTQRYKVESWKQRMANTRVRLRRPRFVYSHVYIGATSDASRRFLSERVLVEH